MKSIWPATTAAISAAIVLQILAACQCVHGTTSTSGGYANRLLETQLKNAAREQEKIGNRLTNLAIQEMQINVNKLSLARNVQTTFASVLAQRGLTDLNNIGRTLTSQSIRECYQLNRFTFADAIATARTETLQCIADKFDEINEIVENGRTNITNAMANVQNVAQMIAQCSILTSSYPSLAGLVAKGACLNAAILTIQADTLLLPINIAKRALEVRASIGRIQTDITRCGLKIVQVISEQSIESARAIAKCVSQQAVIAAK